MTALLRRLGGRRFGPRRTIWPTRDGWWCLFAALALGVAAVNTGNNLVYLLCSLLLALILVSGVLSEQSMRGLRLASVRPEEIYAGRPALFGAVVANRKRRLPSYSITVEVPGEKGRVRQLHLPHLPGGSERQLTWQTVFPARGRHRLEGARITTRFPFGLFVKTEPVDLGADVLVYPAVARVPAARLRAAGGAGAASVRRRGRGHDLYNLRPYRPGDDPRRIHWRSTARVQTLIVRELEDEAARDARVVLTGRGDDRGRLERAVSEAASLAVHLLRGGAGVEVRGPGLLVPLGRGRGQETRILTALALFEAAPPSTGLLGPTEPPDPTGPLGPTALPRAAGLRPATGEPRPTTLPRATEAPGPTEWPPATGPPGPPTPRCGVPAGRCASSTSPSADMQPPSGLRLALSLLVADGLVALLLGDLLGPLGVAIVALGVAASWGAERIGAWLRIPSAVLRLVPPVAAAAALLDLAVFAATALDALVRLLCFLVVYKLFTLHSVRESRTVGFLVFFMLVAAAASAFGVGFLFVFLAFVVLATWVMLQQQVLLDAEPGPARTVAGPVVVGRGLVVLALAGSLGAIVITALLFFVIPRVGLAALPFRTQVGQMVTGFSDRVELGAYGEIATDDSVVMRVHLPDWLDGAEPVPALRWRGIALDTFDGRVWSIGRPSRTALPRAWANEFPVGIPRGTGRILVQEIFLEPLATDIIFAAPRVLHLRVRGGGVQVDEAASFSVPYPAARRSYTVYSELEEGLPARTGARRAPPLDEEARQRHLQLPPLSPRIGALARAVADGSPDAREAASRLSGFLAREYRYTLALDRLTNLDPIEEFLFARRSGNCEYFAASLAVMLRSLGIPARVVNGFQRGEWNPYGRYFMVRLRDAHSWVEAWVGREGGWVAFDPTPRGAGAPGGVLGPVALYLDALRLRWHRYVVNWSLRDQMQAAWSVRRYAVTGWVPWRARVQERLDGRAAGGVLALGALVVGAALLWRWRRPGAPGGPAGPLPPAFYRRALRSLSRSGLIPDPGETAREFRDRVARQAPACAGPFGTLTAAYERCRFGGQRLGSRDGPALDACLRALDRARRAR
jgi:uncharacterized protein (DUF58 family)/transglutaminase-like putative cysteine protease